MYKILAQSNKFSAVVDDDATEFHPYIMWGAYKYDPNNNLRPVGFRGKALNEKYHNEARDLYVKARDIWKNLKQNKPQNLPLFEDKRPASALESLIAESVAKIAVNDVVKIAKPAIDTYIKETYGEIPKRLEVTTHKGTNTISGVVHEKFETVLKLVNCNVPVFLTGPAGCGKNVICKQVAESLGLDFYFSNAVTQEYKLTGFINANGNYHNTQFYDAFTKGGVFMLDEIDASTPEVLVILNAAIANKYFDFPTGRVTAHEDFRIVAAGNTYGTGADIEYTGRYQLDAASLDRFAIIEIDYSETIENAISGGNEELVAFIRDFREKVKEADIKFIVSYRAVERLKTLENVFSIAESIQIALLRGMDKEDVKIISNNITGNTKYHKALKEAV
jgi:MoxR-like ATPase